MKTKNKHKKKKWSRSKWARYYILFCPLHFVVWNLQPAINEAERTEFYDRFNGGDLMHDV